jgi:endoglucanase
MRTESLDLLKRIVNAPSPSGYEEPAAEEYRAYTTSFADSVRTDFHGNVIAALNPEAKTRVMLAGHLDEIGFQVNYINDKGLIYFRGIGGHDRTVPLGQRVWIHTENGRVPGVLGRKPIHLLESKERETMPELSDMWIDIGAKSKEEAISHVAIGDPITYQWEFQELLGGRAAARGFDNKMGAFIVAEALRLLKDEGGLHPEVGVFAVGTVQEEIGLRGAKTSAFGVDAQTGLAVDVNFAIDHPGLSKEKHGESEMSKGPTVARGANINPIVFQMVKEAAAKEEMPIQIEAEPGGTGTDANAMQLNRAGMAVGLVGVAIRYMHTPNELLDLNDVELCARLMAGYCRLVTPETDFTPRLRK